MAGKFASSEVSNWHERSTASGDTMRTCVHHNLVEIHRATRHLLLLYHAANAANYVTGTATICNDVTEQFANFAQINVPAIDKALSSCGVTENSRQRLIQLMSNGCRHFTHQRHTTEMTIARAIALRFEFRLFARRYVDADSPIARAPLRSSPATQLRAPPIQRRVPSGNNNAILQFVILCLFLMRRLMAESRSARSSG